MVGTCNANIKTPDADGGKTRLVFCAREFGHYDGELQPTIHNDGTIDPGGWHQSAAQGENLPWTWASSAEDVAEGHTAA
ncbi:hypothetical protein [Streptomyces sp. NPDC042319]|uniref:hypothetical protein n=1 Tax=Streptomyces sp. NPDC042319 TaxID=3154332 RepID=UPI0034015DEB